MSASYTQGCLLQKAFVFLSFTISIRVPHFYEGKKEFKMSFAFPISIIFPELFTPTLS